MAEYPNSTERKPGEYGLFAVGFAGFGMASGGIVLSSPFFALVGGVVLLIAVSGFRRSPSLED